MNVVVTLRVHESVILDTAAGPVTVTLFRVGSVQVKLGIHGAPEIPVDRAEAAVEHQRLRERRVGR